MSLSANCYVVAAVEAKSLLNHIKKTNVVTKYNEDTGEPYQKNVEFGSCEMFGEECYGVPSPYEIREFARTLKNCPPGLIEVYGESKEFIGILIAEIGTHHENGIENFTIDKCSNAITELSNFLEAYNYKVSVELLLVRNISY